jgi:ADP-heptose:LPS heptosyltransferase
MKTQPAKILISRTDSIGDVVLTLPMAGVLKKFLPGVEVHLLGRGYTRPVAAACEFVDKFWDWDEIRVSPEAGPAANEIDCVLHVFPQKEIAQWAAHRRIPRRIGTRGRWHHWLYCNERVSLSRKKSLFHESQLNLKLLAPLISRTDFSLVEIGGFLGLNRLQPLPERLANFLTPEKFNLILHPKSLGSAREWGLEHFGELIRLLPREHFNVFITGTKAEGETMRPWLSTPGSSAADLTGLMTLAELMAFIARADGLVAASTGPLHLAGALGKFTVGLYPPIRPMHAARWAPLGKYARTLGVSKVCSACRETPNACACMRAITPRAVADVILNHARSLPRFQNVPL